MNKNFHPPLHDEYECMTKVAIALNAVQSLQSGSREVEKAKKLARKAHMPLAQLNHLIYQKKAQ